VQPVKDKTGQKLKKCSSEEVHKATLKQRLHKK